MADRITNLPSSQERPSDIDINVMKNVFGESLDVAKSLQLKKIIIPAIVFIVLSLPIVDSILKNIVSDSDILLMFTKTLIFLIVLVLLQIVS
jgi:hypothetical protein